MARFWIDYSASVLIEAETAEEAKQLFWNGSYDSLKHINFCIDGIEEEKND